MITQAIHMNLGIFILIILSQTIPMAKIQNIIEMKKPVPDIMQAGMAIHIRIAATSSLVKVIFFNPNKNLIAFNIPGHVLGCVISDFDIIKLHVGIFGSSREHLDEHLFHLCHFE